MTGSAFLLSKKDFTEFGGGVDEDFINGGEDVELSLRIRASGRILTCIPESKIYHLESQTPGIHKHALLNASLLKEKALHLIVPDLHACAEKDGYELALTPALKIYFDLPERRKRIYKKLVEQADSDELENLIEKEPLCHAAYCKLARLYKEQGKPADAAQTLYLAMKLKSSHPALACMLADAARSIGDETMLYAVRKTHQQHKNSTSFSHIYSSAEYAVSLTAKLGLTTLSALYKEWLCRREAHSRFYGARFEKMLAGDSALLPMPTEDQ